MEMEMEMGTAVMLRWWIWFEVDEVLGAEADRVETEF